jgi:glutamyl-tRNA synthetase
MTQFRTRQAPSPTGYLHLGTTRQVLFTKLFAMKNQGVWYLRLEDTDRNRLIPEAARGLLKPLEILGLLPDEGVTSVQIGEKDETYGIYQVGDFGPYIQSERQKIHQEHAQILIDKKLAYWSYLTAEDKQELQEIKQTSKRSINYFQICSQRYSEELMYQPVVTALLDENKPSLLYKLQRNEKIICKDELLGETEFDLNLEEDFTILKSDGFPTYHLAHLIDDYLMQTTLVIRAQEWYPSFPKHATMFQDYWGTVPKYIHLPFILGVTGNKKMSKRDGNVNIQDYLDKGYLPEAMINYLAFLGWNPGTDQEFYLEKEDFENGF